MNAPGPFKRQKEREPCDVTGHRKKQKNKRALTPGWREGNTTTLNTACANSAHNINNIQYFSESGNQM